MEELWTKLVDACDEEGNAKGAAHHGILVMYALTKAEGEVAYGLCDTFDLDAFVIGERVVLCSDASMVDHCSRIGGEPGHGTAEMGVDLHDLLY